MKPTDITTTKNEVRITSGVLERARSLRLLVAVLMFANFQFATVFAQGTAFTYQGQLKDGAVPANGTYDLTFSLFGAGSGGSAVGGPVSKLATLVTNGLFTVAIDFGSGQFTNSPRWLEIGVRTNGGGGFTTLSPRQALTPTPYAIYAASAGVGGGSPWLLNGTNTYYNGGRVGIGTTTPAAPLHVADDLYPVIVIQDTGPASTQAGYVTFRNNALTETAWVGFGSPGSLDFSVVNGRAGGDLQLYAGLGGEVLIRQGNLGIGTIAPLAPLDVRGDIRLGPNGEFRATSGEENLRIVRGKIAADASVIRGTGFTATHSGPNGSLYTISFTTPFSAAPVVTASVENDVANSVAQPSYESGTSVDIKIWNSGTAASAPFQFIAIGPR